ncbi:Ulp1 protease family protein [Nitzschia inconspicua]|uniref:Ulp1 protease family protein n=1 Tax=Nitzschia inconspicua TaxID=303405 RepID=A0A9K3P9X8_9STRA|nr:Ulp1 protease family protein [Nitzschia inconspicua]KAG7372412.1 Ulp1 protease family protein [Nitzschia inconspicua]
MPRSLIKSFFDKSFGENGNAMASSTVDDGVMLLNYNDAVIYMRDLRLVVENDWLNDSIIHFYLELLKQESTEGHDYFMDPSVVSFFMQHCNDHEDIEDFVASAPLPKDNGRIFIAVNDKMSAAVESGAIWMQHTSRGCATAQGTHWSLLLMTIGTSASADEIAVAAYHFDSHGECNLKVAVEIATKIAKYMYKRNAKVLSCETPQQVNGYDCGIHVLMAARALASFDDIDFRQQKLVYEQALHKTIVVQHGSNPGPAMRQAISDTITSMASKQLS